MKVHVPLRLDPKTLETLDKRARALGHTRSAYIRFLIERDLRKEKDNENNALCAYCRARSNNP